MNIKEQIKAIEMAVTKRPCVYFLTDEDGEILYVGKSKSRMTGRIAAHEYDKQFSRVFFIECAGYKEMDMMESKMILKIKPKYNRMLTKQEVGMVTMGDVKKEIKVDARFIKKAAEKFNIGMTMIGSKKYYEKIIIEAVKKYIGMMKKQPISMSDKVWITWGNKHK